MARVGVDLDGVVYDFVGQYREFLLGYGDYAYGHYPQPTQWRFFEDWKISEEEFLKHLRNHGREIFREGQPYPGAIKALQCLAAAGHTLVFITDRVIMGEAAEPETKYWLRKHLFVGTEFELHVTADKSSVKVDYFIDDKPENLAAMPFATDVYLCDRPWNKDSGYERMSLTQFVDEVLRSEGSKNKLKDLTLLPRVFENVLLKSYAAGESQEVRITSSTGGMKGKKLARFDLVPSAAMRKVAEVYGRGAEKYDDWNWRKGYDWSLSIASLERHLADFKEGKSYHEDGHSLASVVFHALALMTFEEEHPEFDDRYVRPKDERGTD